jgi:hypothetical protein
VTSTDENGATPKRDARWPFVLLYLFMWAGMFGISLNSDPIKLEYSIAVVMGLLVVAGLVAYLAVGRIRGHSLFGFDGPTFFGNLARHVFILTGIAFIGFLFFAAVIQIMVISLNAPIFDLVCVRPSQRDVALFVWDAMARGALKFLAGYLHLAPDGCTPNEGSLARSATELCIQFFTSIVLVWYAISFAKAWYARLRRQ